MKYVSDTIVAAATPPGRGGVAVIRISGHSALNIAKAILNKTPRPRYALFSPFFDENKQMIDEGLALYFPAPHSFTGEEVIELQGHGGPAVVAQLLKRIVNLGARLAKPGEFSERAFLNNKMDLVQAEAIADLINASSEQAARSAIRSLQGEFSKKITELVESITQLRMYVEAAIDFVEEEIDFLANEQIAVKLKELLHKLTQIEMSATQGSLLREGITVVIAGKPNVGKSSLLNQLSGKEIAIVADIPGTTRDVLKDYILLDGMPIHLIDTAGLRESNDQVEQEGIRRAHTEIAQADLLLHVIDAKEENPGTSFDFPKDKQLTIRNKIDLLEVVPNTTVNEVALSAKTGQGIDALKSKIKEMVGFYGQTEDTFLARQRHLEALKKAKHALNNCPRLLSQKSGELLAEELRQAQIALSEVTGEFTSDDLLGRIFGSFCIGK